MAEQQHQQQLRKTQTERGTETEAKREAKKETEAERRETALSQSTASFSERVGDTLNTSSFADRLNKDKHREGDKDRDTRKRTRAETEAQTEIPTETETEAEAQAERGKPKERASFFRDLKQKQHAEEAKQTIFVGTEQETNTRMQVRSREKLYLPSPHSPELEHAAKIQTSLPAGLYTRVYTHSRTHTYLNIYTHRCFVTFICDQNGHSWTLANACGGF